MVLYEKSIRHANGFFVGFGIENGLLLDWVWN